MALTEASKKYWAPIQKVIDYISTEVIKPDDKVLEIGPGHAPFKRADVSVDFVDVPGVKNFVKIDAANGLPFEDKKFDFVYARHVVEDMWHPFPLIKEMSRVGKAGYIEVPSPFAELGRGVDGSSPPYRGYHHHRWIGWAMGKELRLIGKYPLVEYIPVVNDRVDEALKSDRYWNSYYLWEGEAQVHHYQSPANFNIPRDYATILNEAMERSKEMTDIFFSKIGGLK
jgi:hypothetical protein